MKSRMCWRHQYDDAGDEAAGRAVIIRQFDESQTQQQFTEDADINTLAKRFGLSEKDMPLSWPGGAEGLQAVVPETMDLRSLLDAVNDAKAAFASLPATVRARFHNSPAELDSFMMSCGDNKENRAEAIRLGILEAPKAPAPEPEPMRVRVVPDSPPAGAPAGK